MMTKSTKLIMTGAASLLGVALAAGGAYAATGTLSVSDAPGQVLKVSGVAPASAHASQNALDHANENAKGLFGSATETDETDADTSVDATSSTEGEVTAVAPSEASQNASTVKGSETGQSVRAWAHENNGVEVVAPGAAVTVDANVTVGAEARENSEH